VTVVQYDKSVTLSEVMYTESEVEGIRVTFVRQRSYFNTTQSKATILLINWVGVLYRRVCTPILRYSSLIIVDSPCTYVITLVCSYQNLS
jgi:hypothetical protein